jgi:hypothetical protein
MGTAGPLTERAGAGRACPQTCPFGPDSSVTSPGSTTSFRRSFSALRSPDDR